METKQVIVIRKDLNMRKGKMVAQGCHASLGVFTKSLEIFTQAKDGSDLDEHGHAKEITYFGDLSLTHASVAWLKSSFAKICVSVNSEQALLDLQKRADEAGIINHLVQDNGKTEFGGVKTYTCIAIGPEESSKIDLITGGLPLL